MEAIVCSESFHTFHGNFQLVHAGITGSGQESIGKNLGNFRPEYSFHVPAISGVFSQDPMTGIFDLGTSLINKYIAQIKNVEQYLQTY
jgi:hypothetical protein